MDLHLRNTMTIPIFSEQCDQRPMYNADVLLFFAFFLPFIK